MGNSIVNKIAFQPPNATYDITLYDLEFVTRLELICSVAQEVKIPIRSFCKNDNLPWMLYCHANAMDIGKMDLIQLSNLFEANIIVFDYSGYGLHSKKTSSEQDCYKDIEAVYHQYLLPKVKNPKKIVILGQSLGSTVACHLAYIVRYDKIQPKNLILISPLYSATTIKTWFPLPFLDCFQNYKLAPFIRCATSIYHGDKDNVIPMSCAQELSFLFPNLVRFHIFANTGHNDIFNEKFLFQSVKNQIS